MNKYYFAKLRSKVLADMTPEEAFHDGVSFAQDRMLGWLDAFPGIGHHMTGRDWKLWFESMIDAEDQET